MRLPFFKSPPPPPTEAECLEFKELCERAAAVLGKVGLKTKAYCDPSTPRFRHHPRAGRLLSTVRTYVEVLEGAAAEGEELTDGKRLLWRMIKTLGMVPQHDIFDRIEAEDTVEIYTTDNWQIFRNMRFFECVSMSVEEVLTIDWTKDSQRDGKITLRLLAVLFQTKTGILRRTVDLSGVPTHKVQEMVGEKWKMTIQLKWFSPLRKDGRLTAGIVTNRSEVTDRGSELVSRV